MKWGLKQVTDDHSLVNEFIKEGGEITLGSSP